MSDRKQFEMFIIRTNWLMDAMHDEQVQANKFCESRVFATPHFRLGVYLSSSSSRWPNRISTPATPTANFPLGKKGKAHKGEWGRLHSTREREPKNRHNIALFQLLQRTLMVFRAVSLSREKRPQEYFNLTGKEKLIASRSIFIGRASYIL